MEVVEVTLPGGIGVDGVWHRSAGIRSLSGRDEAFLLEEGAAFSAAVRATALLTRCVSRLGPLDAVTAELVRSLSVGDREALLLHLRRLTLGDKMSCVLSCPHPACQVRMDLELSVRELLFPPYPRQGHSLETVVEASDGTYRVRFRLPNGGDQEAVAGIALQDPAAAAEAMLQRCVETVIEEKSGRAVATLPPAVVDALPKVMENYDPQAEILLDLTCPECGRAFVVPFDTLDFFCQELSQQCHDFYSEVHLLAYHYHWSEAEILSMTGRKRRLYLDLLADALGKGRGQ